ncbi:methyltransferase domain-containing protein [Edaphobacter paludis]|uniref:Methyltransferase domain-containing protein n=1 Tax=Edaphobacter paludis TaxID=3035702 RepID=A0AAU7CYE5_9BACT
MPQPNPSPQPAASPMPLSRRLFRRIKSGALRPEAAYRLYLKLKFGTGQPVAKPKLPLPNGTLKSRAEWERALEEAKVARLPLHRGDEKNWDHLAAVFAILGSTTTSARVLDAGAEFYSNVLPTLFAYGYRNLYGINLSFTGEARRGPIRYLHGDITQTSFADGYFDAVSCMSVIEHGVPLEGYLREMHRVLKPGGLLITSTDYYPTAIDTRGKMAHGAAIKVFTKAEIQEILRLAEQIGFESTGPVDLDCSERPVRWEQFGLEYSFVIFTLRKKA